jgi:Tfp pilus assembly PilM family ATPase
MENKFDKKSVVYKILKVLHHYSIEENISKAHIDNIILSGGALQLHGLADSV